MLVQTGLWTRFDRFSPGKFFNCYITIFTRCNKWRLQISSWNIESVKVCQSRLHCFHFPYCYSLHSLTRQNIQSHCFYSTVSRPSWNYRSLAKKGPWVVHITLCSNRGVGGYFVTSLHFTTKKRPCLHYHNLQQDIAHQHTCPVQALVSASLKHVWLSHKWTSSSVLTFQEKDTKFHAMTLFYWQTKSCRKAKQFSEAATVTLDIVFCVTID